MTNPDNFPKGQFAGDLELSAEQVCKVLDRIPYTETREWANSVIVDAVDTILLRLSEGA